MYRLFESVFTNNKESVAIYPTEGQEPFADEVALMAEYKSKLGADMDADAYKAGFLFAFDDNGTIYGAKNFFKEDATLAYRLITVTTENGVTTPNQTSCTDIMDVEAEMYKKQGAAMKKSTVSAILTIGTNGGDIIFNENWVRPIEPVESTPEPEEVTE